MKLRETIEKEHLENYAIIFGFKQEDYKANLILSGGDECLFTGFLPQNTKYKCQAIRISDGYKYKVTPSGIRNGMERYKNRQQNNK